VLAVPFVKVPDVGGQVDDWSGRVVVDATNHFAQYQPSYAGRVDLGSETGSEWVARQLPGATIIKAFNAMFAIYIEADPHHHGRQVVFYAGDDHRANTAFASFGHTLGFALVYVGGLPDGQAHPARWPTEPAARGQTGLMSTIVTDVRSP
jgi:hypothetical protein